MLRGLYPQSGYGRRGLGLAAIGAAAALTLSGCFVISLADGRSPFDDPFGASYRDVNGAVPDVQRALDASAAGDEDWILDVYVGEGNCEGACDLHAAVGIEPRDKSSSSSIPEEVLRDGLEIVVPVAEQHRVDVEVGVYGSAYRVEEADIDRAAEELFGPIAESGIRTEMYSVAYDDEHIIIRAYTREHEGVLQAMGLSGRR